jgi:hypothetical protein
MPIYRIEDIQRLLESSESVLRLVRHFGPPRDHPHPILETVRKQLPIGRAVYKLEGFRQAPRLPASSGLVGEQAVVLRIATDRASFLALTGLPAEDSIAGRQVYFGVDAAPSGTSQHSPHLGIPFDDIDAWLGNRWHKLTRGLLVGLPGAAQPSSDHSSSPDDSAVWARGTLGRLRRDQ